MSGRTLLLVHAAVLGWALVGCRDLLRNREEEAWKRAQAEFRSFRFEAFDRELLTVLASPEASYINGITLRVDGGHQAVCY